MHKYPRLLSAPPIFLGGALEIWGGCAKQSWGCAKQFEGALNNFHYLCMVHMEKTYTP
jgi:hypothetical protein